MKKLFSFMLAACLLTACAAEETSDASAVFRAVVLENNTVSLLVEPEEGTAEAGCANRIIVTMSDASVVKADGAAGTAGDLSECDVVEITYNGAIAESYPAGIRQTCEVRIVGRTDKIPDCTAIANPMAEYKEPVYPEFLLGSYPQEEKLVLEHCWLVSDKIAQLDYKAGSADAIFRAAKDDGSDISGVYFAFQTDETQTVETSDGSLTVRVRTTAAKTMLFTWTDEGWAYSLYLPRSSEKAAEKLLSHFTAVKAKENPDLSLEPKEPPVKQTL